MDFEDDVRTRDRTAYLSVLFAPASVRRALLALAAYRLELGRIVETIRDPLAAEIRLQWWRDAIRDQGFGEGAGIPLVLALRDGMARYHWPATTLADMSEAHIHDLYADPFPDFDAFDGYAGETRGAAIQLGVMALAIDALGEERGLAAARTAGTAAGYAGVALTAVAAASRLVPRLMMGHTLAPETAWRAAGIDVAAMIRAGAVAEGTDGVVRAMIAHGHTADEAMREALATVAPETRAAFLPAMTAKGALDAIARRPLAPREPAAWRTQLTLWRAARRLNRL
ncbi:squalene/phytoene synthase family protein [Acuticoccus sp. M5D2P5]|uniref:squalene/phytoene synthase family protein n=1 Tax=Acuticoccus kalidii TaxID=2910977 RepID=UPI001F15A061|nr:squalene/phytoene synthase family protein [Acuticoccus kalidii]MCF3933063.1 squalene/phytoene synthase family protein [Acuticoccus kalidii]